MDEILDPCPAKICFEESIGIEEVTDYLLEAPEIGDQLGVQIGTRSEKTRQTRVFDRPGRSGVIASLRQGNDVLVTKDFDPRLRKILPEKANRR